MYDYDWKLTIHIATAISSEKKNQKQNNKKQKAIMADFQSRIK